jgi:hypothetical protein
MAEDIADGLKKIVSGTGGAFYAGRGDLVNSGDEE